jgi:zinc transporter, ZIP family
LSGNTAIAVELHNFPEGLATFVAVLKYPKVGFVLAVAIAIHNIPEGIFVCGSRQKTFLLAFLSGDSEPIAAFSGWLVFASFYVDATYAVMFGIVSGMMLSSFGKGFGISCTGIISSISKYTLVSNT